MIVSVSGVGDRKAKELQSAAKFYAELLMNKNMLKNMVIDINVLTKLENNEKGDCAPDEDERISRPRAFTIRLKRYNDDGESILQTLAHEMVHVKQYAKEELSNCLVYNTKTKKYSKKIDTYWKGELWKPKKKEHDYWDSPWEIEAYGRELGLYYRFLDKEK